MLRRQTRIAGFILCALAAAPQHQAEETKPPSDPGANAWVDDTAEAAQTLGTRILKADKPLAGKILVAWIFDRSQSMHDDREILAGEVDNLLKMLQKKVRHHENLLMTVYSVGEKTVLVQKPTQDEKLIAQAIRTIKPDDSGRETPMAAVLAVLNDFKADDSQKIIVLVTDEAGDDAAKVDDVEKELLTQKAQFFCIGAEAGFQTATMKKRVRYTDKNLQGQGNITLTVGPESPDMELAVHPNRVIPKQQKILPGPAARLLPPPEDLKIPSGFGFYAPARLANNSGGAYFVVPDPDPSPVPVDRKKMQAHYRPSYAADRTPETDYGKRLKTILDEIRRQRAAKHADSLCGPFPPKSSAEFTVLAGEALVDIGKLLITSREEIQQIEESEAQIYEVIGDLKNANAKKKKIWKDEAAARSDSRWEANALLSLLVLGEERARLAERVRLLREAVDKGKFSGCTALDPKAQVEITFTLQPAGSSENSPLTKLLKELHAETPWAWWAQEIEKAKADESIQIEFNRPQNDSKHGKGGLPFPPISPPPKGY